VSDYSLWISNEIKAVTAIFFVLFSLALPVKAQPATRPTVQPGPPPSIALDGLAASALLRAYDEFRAAKDLPDSPTALRNYIVELRQYGEEFEVRFIPSLGGTSEAWKVENGKATSVSQLVQGGVSKPTVIPGIVVSELKALSNYAIKSNDLADRAWLSTFRYHLELRIGGGSLQATFVPPSPAVTPGPSPRLICLSGCSGGETYTLLLSGDAFTVRRIGTI
jgi:hypothetical protein